MTNKAHHSPINSSTVQYCESMKTLIESNQTFHECISTHQCFSDVPCPLQEQFNIEPIRFAPSHSKHSLITKS